MKVLITGTTGYLGKIIKEDLERLGCDIIAGKRNAKPEDFDVNFSQYDFKRSLACYDGLDSVIHLAASTNTYPHPDELRYSKALISYCQDKNIQIITTSSISAFSGNTNPYSILKMMAEDYGKQADFGIFLKLGIVLGRDPQGVSKKIYDLCDRCRLIPLYLGAFRIFVTDETLLIREIRSIVASRTKRFKRIELGSEIPMNLLMVKMKNSLGHRFIPIVIPHRFIWMALKALKICSQSFSIRQIESLLRTSKFLISRSNPLCNAEAGVSGVEQEGWEFESKNIEKFWLGRFYGDLGKFSAEQYQTSCHAAEITAPCSNPIFLLFPQAYLSVSDTLNFKNLKKRLLVGRILLEHLKEEGIYGRRSL